MCIAAGKAGWEYFYKITWEILLSNRKAHLVHIRGDGSQLHSQNELPADSCPLLKQTSFLVYFP